MKLAITGTPGVGKSTISKHLKDKLTKRGISLEYIDLTEVVKREKLYIEKDEHMDSYVVDFPKLREYLKDVKGDVVILDGHISHLLDVDYIVVLRCNPQLVKERLKKRGYSKEKIKENVGAEILDVSLIESLERLKNENIPVYEIDTTNRCVEEVVEEIIENMKNKKVRYGVVDWLEDFISMID
ncbi:MAG TPA: kinase [Methanothermococcus okinawensis]|uniref:Putative adenylate kinase n=1 Tax=Methanothermococcus okinawensis TaxID=155863 RepID=A0A833E281_9EURY|nr:kinase [Methanothermococcus okinawensis]